MFARSNIVQTSIASVRQNYKTDEDLINEMNLTVIEDELPPGRDPSRYGAGTVLYHVANFSKYAVIVTEGKYESIFNAVIIAAIVAAGVLVGLQTYPELEEDPPQYIIILNNIVLVVFGLEFIFKIIAEGTRPQRYFVGPDGFWNCFDFIVLVFSIPNLFPVDETENKTTGLRMLSRVARLIRLAKIIKRIPQLHVIIKGLVGGMTGISFIGILLGLVFYVYAVAGVLLFRDNDPFHFGTISVALMSLFRAATLENWGDIMYINFYGCSEYTGGLYVVESDFPAITRGKCMDSIEEYPAMYRCYTNSTLTRTAAMGGENPQRWASSLFWLSFIVISSLVMLSLFIGVVTMSMQDSMAEMRNELNDANRKSKLKKATSQIDLLSKKVDQGLSPQPSADEEDAGNGIRATINRGRKRVSTIINKSRATIIGSAHKEKEKIEDIRKMKYLMMQAWHGTAATDDHNTEFDHSDGSDISDFVNKIARKLSLKARDVLHTAVFNHLVTAVICLTAVVVGIQANKRESDNELNVLEWSITGFYGIEILIRFAAAEFHVVEYIHDTWNVFDCLVWVGSLAFYKESGGLLVVLRTLRLLRVLKLVKSLPQLALIVNALIMGLSSIGFIGVILFLAFYMFSILGIFLFRANDLINFGTLELAFLALFRCATLDDWGQVMYSNMYGCQNYPPPYCAKLADISGEYNSCDEWEDAAVDDDTLLDDQFEDLLKDERREICGEPFIFDACENASSSGPQFELSVAFFATFVVVAALVLLTLFVGVVTTSMEEASKQQDIEMEMEKKIQEICAGHEVTKEQLDIYRRVFNMLDLDGGGTIDPQELRVGLRCVNIFPTPAQLEAYVIEIDQNNDGSIDLVEFVVFMTNMKEKNIAEKKKRDEAERKTKGAMSSRFGMSFYGSPKAVSDQGPGALQKRGSSLSFKAMSDGMKKFFGGEVDTVEILSEDEVDKKQSIYSAPPLRPKPVPGTPFVPPTATAPISEGEENKEKSGSAESFQMKRLPRPSEIVLDEESDGEHSFDSMSDL